jgi:rubrerythrin
MQESAKAKEELENQKKELTDVKKESHKRKKLLIAQQHLIHAGSGSKYCYLFVYNVLHCFIEYDK